MAEAPRPRTKEVGVHELARYTAGKAVKIHVSLNTDKYSWCFMQLVMQSLNTESYVQFVKRSLPAKFVNAKKTSTF